MSRTPDETFMNDPMAFFDRSITKMHEIPRDELESLQRSAMALRFAEQRESIAMLRKLAERLDIKEVRSSTISCRSSSPTRPSSRTPRR